MQVWQKGAFRVVVEEGDTDPPAADELDISLRVKLGDIAGVGGILDNRTISTAREAFDVLRRIEEHIAHNVGNLAPEIRDVIRNELAHRVPGLPKVLGWGERSIKLPR